MKVVILAGGFGTRLTEETEIKPKPMVEIGEMPILLHIMKHYLHFGLTEFVIALGYKGDYIKGFFKDYHTLSGNLTIDINFMFRIPLWSVTLWDSHILGSYKAEQVPLLDIHEIVAGKLCALLSRQTGRDLFDAHQLLTQRIIERERLRLAFVVFGAMNRKDWRTVSEKNIRYSANELMNELAPVLRSHEISDDYDREAWASHLVDECRKAISLVLPFTEGEREFLDRILDHGEINPSLISKDENMVDKIRNHPGLQWKALNVREFKGVEKEGVLE